MIFFPFPGDDEDLAEGSTVNPSAPGDNAIDNTNQIEDMEDDDKTMTSASSEHRPCPTHTPMDEDRLEAPEVNSRNSDLQSPLNGSHHSRASSSMSPKPLDSPRPESRRSDSLDHLDRSVVQSPASSVASDTLTLQQSMKFSTLRLNAQLASDPALQPDAKSLKGPITIKTEPDDLDSSSQIIPSPILATELRAPQKQPPVQSTAGGPPRIPIYMCAPCGIRFSSVSTLEAHQTYYCTHRKIAEEGATTANAEGTTTPGGKHPLGETGTSGALEPPAKSIRTGKQYACNQCSYSADKKVSLNRHKRMHQTSPTPSSTTSNGGDFMEQQQQQQLVQGLAMTVNQLAQVDRYCTDCDIRFNSTKTFKAHKQHYCSSRHREG